MTGFARFLLPNRISSQITVIIVVGLLTIHALVTLIFILSRPDERSRHESPGQLGALARLIDRTASSDRPGLLAKLDGVFPEFELALADPQPAEIAWLDRGNPHDPLLRRFDQDFRIGVFPSGDRGGPAHGVAIRLTDGQIIMGRIAVPPPPPRLFGPAMITLMTLAFTIALLTLWATRALTAPLRAFAAAAEAFRPEGDISELAETGPVEIKTAARAFNRMRERIKRLIDDRTRMLAALGHDLRTPITRLRLRSEFITDGTLRQQMTSDLDQMSAMVESVLVLLRNERGEKKPVAVDISASLQTICDGFADLGHRVRYRGPDHAVIKAHPDELHRALTNVIDNAVRYGGCATIALQATESKIVITIDDEGPGIAGEAQKAAMLEPFVRGEAARSMDDATGFGLGLSIAQSTVAAHGGTLTLRDRLPSGLSVRIELPAPITSEVMAPIP